MVDEGLRITSYRGDVSEYLGTGELHENDDLMTIVRAALRPVLSATIEQARRTDVAVIAESPWVTAGDRHRPVGITVIPVSLAGIPQHFLILLGRRNQVATLEHSSQHSPGEATAGAGMSVEEENANLKQELKSTREYLQSVIEELRSTNEEVQSANEELRSTNEEMQTSREELQSSNEELNTINAEMQGRNSELAQVNDDLDQPAGLHEYAHCDDGTRPEDPPFHSDRRESFASD